MTNDGLMQALKSPSPLERAQAAARLLSSPDQISTRELMRALQEEPVAQVRRTLLDVLEARQRASVSTKPVDSNLHDSVDAASVGFESGDIAALVRHELSPAVGWIKLAADSEIDGGFAGSKTEHAVRRLQLRIDGLVNLIKSRTALSLTKVELPYALLGSWPDPLSSPRIDPAASDGDSVSIETDEGLFALLMFNVFQNAIDASLEAVGAIEVDVTWGHTDQSYWIRVTNPFRGTRLSLNTVITDGSSSKAGHQGKGLPLIRDVADRLGVRIELAGASGVASFTIAGEVNYE